VFQQVLKNRFPHNLILSHDLLESNYLRCGTAIDIEVIDDFPSKFLVDASEDQDGQEGYAISDGYF
jgi:hypothetical protein